MLEAAPKNTPKIAVLLLADELLDTLDEQLVRIERSLPKSYISDAEKHAESVFAGIRENENQVIPISVNGSLD